MFRSPRKMAVMATALVALLGACSGSNDKSAKKEDPTTTTLDPASFEGQVAKFKSENDIGKRIGAGTLEDGTQFDLYEKAGLFRSMGMKDLSFMTGGEYQFYRENGGVNVWGAMTAPTSVVPLKTNATEIYMDNGVILKLPNKVCGVQTQKPATVDPDEQDRDMHLVYNGPCLVPPS